MASNSKSTIIIFLATIIIYVAAIKPARLLINEKLFLPAISSIFPNYEVNVATNGTAVIVINHREDKNNAFSHKHLNTITRKHYLALPFGGMFIIPFVLLVFQKNWELAKKFTFYHLFLTIIPIVLLMINFNVFNIIPSNIFQRLNIVLGFVFTILAIRKPVASTH